jgi:ribosomal protein L17
MYDMKSMKAEEFISDEEIQATLWYADENKDNMEVLDTIIAKAKLGKGLSHREASVLWPVTMRKSSRRSMIWQDRLRRIITVTV